MRSIRASRFRALAVMAALLAAGCGKDPAASVNIALGGLIDGGVEHGGERTRRPWQPTLCPPLPEPAGPKVSRLGLEGACPFEHSGPARCKVSQDDLYLTVSRPAREGAVVTLYVNVERYRGPGRYDAAEVQLSVQDRAALFRWSGGAQVTVESGEAAVAFDRVLLSPEPGTSTEGDEWLEGAAACADDARGD
jgi:hypothetical protein